MAISKSVTVLMQNQNNATSPVAVSFTAEPIVLDGRLVPSYRVSNPGVFTQGTAFEGSANNPNTDSNN